MTLALSLVVAASTSASSGIWERAWGKDVVAGNAEIGFEVCALAASCKGGVQGGLGGEMRSPDGIAIDAAGNVYVADEFNHRIQKFDSNGNWERAWGRDVVIGGGTGFEICTMAANCKAGVPGGLGGEMNHPPKVAADAAGNVYVADRLNGRIQKFTAFGSFDRAWGKDVVAGNAETGFEVCALATSCKAGAIGSLLGGEMNNPADIATDAVGNVYVAEAGRIQKFDSFGNWERAWGKDVVSGAPTGFEVCTVAASCKEGAAGGLGGEMIQPDGLATQASGTVYVADSANRRIQKFDSLGNWERAWGKDVVAGNAETGFEVCALATSCKAGALGSLLGGEMNFPEGVATDSAGHVYVADNRRIQKFDSLGTWERAWGKDVVAGNAEIGFEVCILAASCKGGEVGSLGGEMFFGRGGLATDATGNVYLPDTFRHRIQKFADPPAAAAIPSNAFRFGKLKRNRRKGVAILAVILPGPGDISLRGPGIKSIRPAQASRFTSGGEVKLRIAPGKGKAGRKLRRALRRKGKARRKVTVTYTPTGGAPNAQSRAVKLIKK